MREKLKLTQSQMDLLRDLAALEDAGLIQGGDEVTGHTDYDGNPAVFMAPTVTYAGRALLQSEDGR